MILSAILSYVDRFLPGPSIPKRFLFCHGTFFQYDNFIGAGYGAHAVGNYEHCFIFDQTRQRCFESVFHFSTSRSSGFIQKNDSARLLEKPWQWKYADVLHPKVHSRFPRCDCPSIGQFLHKFITVGQSGGMQHLFVSGILFANTDIFQYCMIE